MLPNRFQIPALECLIVGSTRGVSHILSATKLCSIARAPSPWIYRDVDGLLALVLFQKTHFLRPRLTVL